MTDETRLEMAWDDHRRRRAHEIDRETPIATTRTGVTRRPTRTDAADLARSLSRDLARQAERTDPVAPDKPAPPPVKPGTVDAGRDRYRRKHGDPDRQPDVTPRWS